MKHRFATEQGIELIKRFEGFSSTPYFCSAGVLTIGIGHAIRNTEQFDRLTEDEAEELLKKDLFLAERSVLRLLNIPLTDNQFSALCSFAFNLGGGALQRSTLRMRLNRGEDKEEVGAEFLKWVYAGGRVLKGLLRRREAEREMFLI